MPRNAARRASRIRALDATQAKREETISALRRMHVAGVRPAVIRVRSVFFTGNPYTPPPIARISANRGLNLQLYLIALFEAQSRKRAGAPGPSLLPVSSSGPSVLSWAKLAVSEAKQNTQAAVPITELQNRARQVKSAIKRLADESLIIRNPGDPRAPYSLMLLHESGGSRRGYYEYVIPEWHENPKSIISIPVEFFTRGWVYMLTDAEIRMYFILKHLAIKFPKAHEEHGVYLVDRDREWLYAITRDIYEAHLTLSRFGLIRLVDNPLRHKDGKVVDFKGFVSRGGLVPLHRFKVEPVEALRISPAPRIRRALLNYPPSYSGTGE